MKAYLPVVSALTLLWNLIDCQASTLLPIGSGFNSPLGLAVDSNGNVFVADQGNNAVKEILAAGGYTTVNTLGSGFSAPSWVAVDASGNVFVVDAGNTVVKEILASGGYSTVNTLGSGYSNLVGIGVDASSNVFVADTGGTATELVAAGGYTTVNVIGSNLGASSSLAVDPSANVFLIGARNLTELVATGGYSTVKHVSYSGVDFFASSFGAAATDASGNVFAVKYEVLPAGGAAIDIMELLASSNFANYNNAYFTSTTLPAVGICVSNSALFFTGLNTNSVDELAPVPTPVTLQDFTVD